MSRIINVAILGAGNIARAMAAAVNGIPEDAKLYAVASRSLEKAREFAEKWGVEKAYGSYEEMVKDDNIDLIYVATPHSEHYKNTKLCLENGRNCLVEKAFCANRAQAQELIEIARDKKLLLAEAMWTRYQPNQNTIRKVLTDGELGILHYMEADFSINIRGVDRLEKPELAGGALLDLGVYSLTTALMYFGTDLERVRANTVRNDRGVDLSDDITFIYKDKKMAKITCSFDYQGRSNYAKIVGDKGFMTFAPINAPTELKIYDVDGRLVREEEMGFIANGYEYQVLECRDAILAGEIETKSMPHSETLRLMGWMDSIRQHGGVFYPFETEEDRKHSDLEVWGIENAYDDVVQCRGQNLQIRP